MPNHVTNILSFRGEKERIKKIFDDVKNDTVGVGSISFEKIIPMPDNIYRGNLGIKEREEYGSNNWYDFSIANWGTKWNAYGFESFMDGNGENEIRFLTAWSAPHPVIDKLAQLYPDVEIKHEWADEALGENCGSCSYSEGEIIEKYYPETYKDCYEFAARVHDITLNDIGLYLNADETDYIDISGRYYFVAMINGIKCLITTNKTKKCDIPKGLYCYDICSSNNDYMTIEKSSTNVVGAIISKVKFLLGAENRMPLEGSIRLDRRLTLENYMLEE